MFPSAGDQVYYNEAGEPLGWDKAEDNPDEVYYCDTCGFSHSGSCPDPSDVYEELDEPSDEEE